METPPNNPPYDPNDPNRNPWQNSPYAPNQQGQQNYNPNQGNYGQQNYQQQNYYPPQNAQGGWGQNPYQNFPYMAQRDLPNASAVLVLGIISILGALCYGVVGVGLGITSIVMANKAIKEYEANAGFYSSSSLSNIKAGRICAIIGLSLGALFLLVIILELIFVASFMNAFRF